MLSEALDFPTRGDDGAAALLVGAGLLFVAGLFQLVGSVAFPLLGGALLCRIAVRGYYVRVYRRTAVDLGADAPAFDEWGDLFTEGLYSLVIFLVYLVPLVVLLGLAGGGGAMTSVDDPSAAVDALRNAAGLALLLALLYFLGMWYVLPAAVSNYAHEGELRAAFRPGEVLDGAVSEDYAVGWVLTVVVQVLVWPVAFLLQFLLVGFFISFFVGVAVRSILGRSFGAARGYEPDATDVPWREPTGGVGKAPSGTGRRHATSGVPGRGASPGGPADADVSGDRGPRVRPGEPADSDAGPTTGHASTRRDTTADDHRATNGDARQSADRERHTDGTSDDGRARTPAEDRELFGTYDSTVNDPTVDGPTVNDDPDGDTGGSDGDGGDSEGGGDRNVSVGDGDEDDGDDDPLADEFPP